MTETSMFNRDAVLPRRVVSLSEIATLLGMKRSNVAKFLARRGIAPAIEKAQGYFWWADEIEKVKAEREADTAKLEADRKRRATALRGRAPEPEVLPPALKRMGARERSMLAELMLRPVTPRSDASRRAALRRLSDRGLCQVIPGSTPITYALTSKGAEAGGAL